MLRMDKGVVCARETVAITWCRAISNEGMRALVDFELGNGFVKPDMCTLRFWILNPGCGSTCEQCTEAGD
jgi:hypothetical protein